MNDDERELREAFERLSAPHSLTAYAERAPRSVSAAPPRRWRNAAAAALVALITVGGAAAFLGLRSARQPSVASSAGTPSARSGAAMVFDSTSRLTVLFGGLDGAQHGLSDTWEWNGIAWSPLATADGPPALIAPRLVDDPADKGVLLLGAVLIPANPPTAPVAQTWLLSAGSWREVSAGAADPPLGATVGTVRSDGDVLALAVTGLSGCQHSTTVACPVPAAPLKQAAPPACLRPDTAPAVAINGCYSQQSTWTTWRWHGGAWSTPSSPLSTTSRDVALLPTSDGLGLVFVAQTDPVELFCVNADGGCPSSTRAVTAWRWTGGDWVADASAAPVPSMFNAAVATSGSHGLIVTETGGTWQGSLAGWTQLTAFGPNEPTPRLGETLAYDRYGHVVLFGGSSVGNGVGARPGDDTWTWDGANWQQAGGSPPSAPTPCDESRVNAPVCGPLASAGSAQSATAVPLVQGTALP